jgi:hypothetical protein
LGCKCCRFRVDGKLVDYKGIKKDSTLEIDGTTVTFVVTDPKVDERIKNMGGSGANGQFILNQKEFEHTASHNGVGTRLECVDVSNTSVEARNKEFIQGITVSAKVYELIEALFSTTPTYAPEFQEDK